MRAVSVAMPESRPRKLSAVRSAVSSAPALPVTRSTGAGGSRHSASGPSRSIAASGSSRRKTASATPSPEMTPGAFWVIVATPRAAGSTVAATVTSPSPTSSASAASIKAVVLSSAILVTPTRLAIAAALQPRQRRGARELRAPAAVHVQVQLAREVVLGAVDRSALRRHRDGQGVRGGGIGGALDLDAAAGRAGAQPPRPGAAARPRPVGRQRNTVPSSRTTTAVASTVAGPTPTGPPAKATETSSPKSCA